MKRIFTQIKVQGRKLRESREGAVSIFMAGMLVVLLGMTGLAVEVGLVLYKYQQQQTAADAAASGAALALTNGESATAAAGEAKAIAANSGYVNGANNVVVTINNPPVSPPAVNTYVANSAVQAIIQQQQTLMLANLVTSWYGTGPINWTVQASAVAKVGGGSTPCALQLSSGVNPGVSLSNGATITLDSCGLQVCSGGNTALSMTGGTQINLTDTSGSLSTSQSVSVTGTVSISNGATINGAGNCSSPSCKQSQPTCNASIIDPYNGRAFPAKTGSTLLPTYNTSTTISAGQWTNGVSFGGGAHITMNPGIYFVDNGTFNVGGGATLTGTGVTIVLAATGSSYANVSIANGGAVTLSAPTTGTTAGIAFFGDPVVSGNNQGTETFTGGAVINITGAIYFPQQTVAFAGGVNNPSGCTQLIAGTISFQGGANFSNNCGTAGTSPIGGGGGATGLVE